MEIPSEIEFTEADVCTLHEFRDYCTAGSCLATASCTVDCVVQAGLLNIPRVDYGLEIVAEDAAYVIADLERTMGLVPRYAEDGTEIYPEVIGCPVHSGNYWYDPELDWPWNDPSDPNYIPPLPGYEEEEPPVEEPQQPQQPEQPPVEEPPVAPQEPVEPEPPAPGGEDDWWSDFWEEENQG